jgi:ribosomal-protein-alanine N-acetyltransferase
MAGLPLPIIGERVIVRSMSENDLPQFYALHADEAVKRYVGGSETRPREQWIAGMRKHLDQSLALTVKSTGDFVGSATLTLPGLPSSDSELRVLIARPYWGRCYGREVSRLLIKAAFEDLGACSVVAIVHPANRASLDLCEALGFRFVEIKQNGTWDKGHHRFELPKRSWNFAA